MNFREFLIFLAVVFVVASINFLVGSVIPGLLIYTLVTSLILMGSGRKFATLIFLTVIILTALWDNSLSISFLVSAVAVGWYFHLVIEWRRYHAQKHSQE
jgi:predicted membrane protein